MFQRIGRFRNPATAIRVLLGLVRHGRGFDVIFANDPRALLYSVLAGRLLGRPCVWHVHDIITGGSPFERAVRWARPSAYIAISDAVRQALVRQGCPVDQITVVHNALDLAHFHPGDDGTGFREELGVPPNALLVGSVGRIVPWKAVETLLEAAARLRDRLPEARFVVVGGTVTDDAHADEARRYRDGLLALRSRLGLDERVKFVGHRDDVARIMAGLDILAHTAIEEPFGRVIIEAMALGRVVVATRGGGVGEIVRDGITGYLVPPRDPAAMAARIEALIDPVLREQLGRAARADVVARFDVTRYHAAVVAVVRAVARGVERTG